MTNYANPRTPQDKIDAALNVAFQDGQVDGAHHKAWVIDQMVRILAGDKYDEFIEAYKNGDAEFTYDWDTGIAP